MRARIDDAARAGALEIVLSGGEPTMRTDLVALVAHAARALAAEAHDGRGERRVVLETNGTLLDDARAGALAEAGVSIARVNLVGADARVDAVTRDPGGFGRTVTGLGALVRAGIAVEILAAVTRASLALLPALPAMAALHGVRTIWMSVPTRSPDPEELVGLEEAAFAIVLLEASARQAGVSLRMSPSDGIPPCVFPRSTGARIEHLFTLTPGAPRRADSSQVDACVACVVSDRCSGFPNAYLARAGVPKMRPVKDERARRSLSIVSSVEEQIARELVTQSLNVDKEGKPRLDETIRVSFHCNQSCTFCFVSTHLPPPERADVDRAIRDAGARGSKISLSGGEPTLSPRLLDYVRLAKAAGSKHVTLQTNAIKLDDVRLVRALKAAGLDDAFVSLHGATAETSDAVTCSPGTFARTASGLDNLAREGVAVVVNFVICQKNYRELPELVRMVAARWPGFIVNISFVAASTDVVPRETSLIPRYADVMPMLAEATREASRLGVETSGWESMCGIPLCLVPASLDCVALVEIPPGEGGGEFMKVDACRGCKYETTCFGIRRGYADLYGTSELHRVPS